VGKDKEEEVLKEAGRDGDVLVWTRSLGG